MKLKKLIITFFLLPAAFGYAQTQSTQIVAHRGFWKTNGSAQNSIAALMKADSVGCYGSEFDVWLTDDDQLEELEDAFALKNISNMPARVKCAVLAWHTLKDALEREEK